MANVFLDCLPPKCEYLTYLTIIEPHLSPDTLPNLNDVLQDPVLTQNIGWDLIHHLLPIPGSETCLNSIARLGNPREVILKVTEALQLFQLNEEDEKSSGKPKDGPANIDKFCTLVGLLSILHPRIKTKYPSRFLSSTLKSILSAYRPIDLATLSVISFLHTISGKKRPSLPSRNLTLDLPHYDQENKISTPDPEAQEAEPEEAEAQERLLQSFITHILEEYINKNSLEWATRLQETLSPEKVIEGRSVGKAFREDPTLQVRDSVVGQLVALSRDLGLTQYETLLEIIYKTEIHLEEQNLEENAHSTSDDIPISKVGSLFLISSFIFSSVLFNSQLPLPKFTIFPEHADLVKYFISANGPDLIGEEALGVIDAILAIGLWLESKNQFVAGPIEDLKFFSYLQSISLLSLNTPSPSLRYAAHLLCSSVLHAHPIDRLRLSFISDTLENCPYELLKASAVAWLKEEILTEFKRNSGNIFSTPVALTATQPFLFPAGSKLLESNDEELLEEISESSSFHMAVLNFLFFLIGKQISHILPSGMLGIVKKLYLSPLKSSQERAVDIISHNLNNESENLKAELYLIGERVNLCLSEIDKLEAKNLGR